MKKLLSALLLCLAPSLVLATTIKEHEEMIGPYDTPQDVTRDCIRCHEDQAKDLSHSRHWQWQGEAFQIRGKEVKLGKRSILNNYCVAISSNEPRCTSCHVGFGWKDDSFDLTAMENMDCLVCHDQTGTYKKFPTDAGYPVFQEDKFFAGNNKTYKKIDLQNVALNVGMPKNENCGACHFYGGGGHNVKHGDLTKALVNATPDIDVHMGHADPEKRQNCASCHKVEGQHTIRGALHASMAAGQNHFGCVDCHNDEDVHKKRMRNTLNMHTLSVACETCHIPVVAKKFPTKTWWDWTTSGDKQRKPIEDENGKEDYSWKKGDFRWTKNLQPEYYWHNGKTDYQLLGETIRLDDDGVMTLNPLLGARDDASSKISPFKVMRGKQFKDKNTNQLLVPHLFGKGGYWKTTDWDKAFQDGMKSVGLSYSGEYDAVETRMFWPVFHQVSPARDALKCADCHTKDEGKKGRLDWNALGYPGDPVKTGNSRIANEVVDW